MTKKLNKNLLFLFAVSFGYIGPAISNNQTIDCRETDLSIKYVSLMAAEKAPPLVAFGLLAITQGKGSGAYKNLERLAKKDPKFAEVKRSVDQLTDAMDRQVSKVKLYREIQSNVRFEYEREYGPDWRDSKGGIDLKQRARWEIAKRARNAGIKNSDYGLGRDLPTVSDEFLAETDKIKNSAPPQIKNQIGLLAKYAESYMNLQVSGVLERSIRGFEVRSGLQGAREDFNRVLGQITSEVSGKSATKKISSVDKGRVAGALGLVLVGSVDLASKAQAQEAVDSCKESWGVESKDVPLLANYVVRESLPGALGPGRTCSEVTIDPSVLDELPETSGASLKGLCSKVSQQYENLKAKWDSEIDLDLKTCAQSNLKINGKEVGTFYGTGVPYFEIPKGDSEFVTRIPISHNKGLDFDSSNVECFRLKEGVWTLSPTCTDRQKGFLNSGMPNLSAQDKKDILFRAEKICPQSKGNSFGNHLCEFAENSRGIRKAAALYLMSCTDTLTGKQVTPKTAEIGGTK